jgi:hypothetical protein
LELGDGHRVKHPLHRRTSAKPKVRSDMAIAPKTKREEDVAALLLFCLFSIVLSGFIAAGIL